MEAEVLQPKKDYTPNIFISIVSFLVGCLVTFTFLVNSPNLVNRSDSPASSPIVNSSVPTRPKSQTPIQSVQTIKSLPVLTEVEDGDVIYKFEYAYLVPQVADLPQFPNHTDPSNPVLVVAVTISNEGLGSNPVPSNSRSFIRLQTAETKKAPNPYGPGYSYPQSENHEFIFFEVPGTLNNASLLVGNLASPTVIPLDFDSENATTLEGEFNSRNGFIPKK